MFKAAAAGPSASTSLPSSRHPNALRFHNAPEPRPGTRVCSDVNELALSVTHWHGDNRGSNPLSATIKSITYRLRTPSVIPPTDDT
jgi:hypothetical protein